MNYRKKLIEVDLPLDDINRESAREKQGAKPGHPSMLHIWWARRPLAACRAVIFASLVDDPSACPEEFPTESEQTAERKRLHDIIRRLVIWKNSNAEELIAQARYEIARSVARSHGETAPTEADAVLRYLDEKTLPIYDPFCGGGSIPIEAQRLGLRAVASDLNPVAVLLNKATIELPHPFRNQPPVNPEADPLGMFVGTGRKRNQVPWTGTAGLADDIRYYGRWMREEAYKRIGEFYPKVKTPDGSEATVIAWLWARTVPCINPACRIPMPLIKTFQLSKKKGNEHWTRPVVDRESNTISFVVQNHDDGVPDEATVDGSGVRCIACGTPTDLEYVRGQGTAGNIEKTMTAIVAEGEKRKKFLSPTTALIQDSVEAQASWKPRGKILGFSARAYGFTEWHQLFTERQLTALTTFSDLLREVRVLVKQHGSEDAYANLLNTYLALALDKTVAGNCTFARWGTQAEAVLHLFSRQAIQTVWDFPEANPFAKLGHTWMNNVEWIAKVVEQLPVSANPGEAYQADAATTPHATESPVVATDPPYYDNISYADLSDFFYVWLRPSLREIYPELFAGMSTPKEAEMIVNRHRSENTRDRFEELQHKTLRRIRERCSDQFPSSIFYAYKQQEEERDGRVSTGWETMLTAIISAGFQIVGTWPMRTELVNRPNSLKANALASSIVLVCRPRPESAQSIGYGGFLTALRSAMPAALDRLTREAHIAPVDLAQAAIGPGMEVYSRYSSVKTMRDGELVEFTVREALMAINREIDNYHEQQEGEFDPRTRFCLTWFKQHGYASAAYGEAETLAKASVVAIQPMETRVLTAEGGRVQLLPPEAYGAAHPNADASLAQITTWEACYLMVYQLNPANEESGDVSGAARVVRAMRDDAESSDVVSVERLARLLYNHYDRLGDSANAVLFNNLVTSWESIESRSSEDVQEEMDF